MSSITINANKKQNKTMAATAQWKNR